jgi:hypothetical protein
MMSDEPLTFQLLFTIPRMASAYARHPDGGSRMKIDIEESAVAAANAMLDLMVKRPRTIFAAVVVVVEEDGKFEEILTNDREARPETDNRTKERPTRMALSRVQRPTD